MRKQTRWFKPRSKWIKGFEGDSTMLTKVDMWIWTSSRGLRCVYTDGLASGSDYTLKELITIEQPVEIYPPEKYA